MGKVGSQAEISSEVSAGTSKNHADLFRRLKDRLW